MNAKYHYLFWRPVTAIDPTSVSGDGYGAVPGPTTATRRLSSNRAGGLCLRRRIIPSTRLRMGRWQARRDAVLSAVLGTSQINVDLHGFDPNGPAGNLTRCATTQPSATWWRRQATLASGPASTIASPFSPATRWARRSPTTTSSMPSNLSASSSPYGQTLAVGACPPARPDCSSRVGAVRHEQLDRCAAESRCRSCRPNPSSTFSSRLGALDTDVIQPYGCINADRLQRRPDLRAPWPTPPGVTSCCAR